MLSCSGQPKLKIAAICLLLFQVVVILFLAFLANYDPSADAKRGAAVGKTIVGQYAKFQDVNVMIFVGFGFLMTFLRRYGLSSFGFNMLLSAFVIEWAVIVHGVVELVKENEKHFNINLTFMFASEFAAASVLISFGAVLGITSMFQLIVMAFIEIVMQRINEFILIDKLHVVDVGGSMLVHAFGAYFGLAVSRVLYIKDIEMSSKGGTVYHSDLFSLIGTVFLWVYWPSFNGALATGDAEHRAIINTLYALVASTVVTFAVSSIVDNKAKISVVHAQNATLAGGVAVGTSADLMIQPYGATVIGAVAGLISVIGYQYITPFLSEKMKIWDTCGVNNLHGMPAVLAGVAASVASAIAYESTYGGSLYSIFEARSPMVNSTELLYLNKKYGQVNAGLGRSGVEQGAYQFLGLVITLAIAIASGIVTGFILRLGCFNSPRGQGLFEDAENWCLPDDGVPVTDNKDNINVCVIEDKLNDLETVNHQL